jgi:hypothetical protein
LLEHCRNGADEKTRNSESHRRNEIEKIIPSGMKKMKKSEHTMELAMEIEKQKQTTSIKTTRPPTVS